MAATTLAGNRHLVKFVTICRPPEEVYRFWRDLSNLPRFLRPVQTIEVTSPTRSHWIARLAMNLKIEWDAEIINEKENELIAWRSLEGADVPNAGSVRFLPVDQGRATEVKVVLNYERVVGGVGSAIARLFGEAPEDQVYGGLHCLQQILETGEMATIEGQPRGQCS